MFFCDCLLVVATELKLLLWPGNGSLLYYAVIAQCLNKYPHAWVEKRLSSWRNSFIVGDMIHQ